MRTDIRYINGKEAMAMMGVSQRALKKLKVSGTCCTSKVSPSVHLFDRSHLAQTITDFKNATRALKCAATLGVPGYVVGSLIGAGILMGVDNKDAALLSDQLLIKSSSIDDFVSKLSELPVLGGSGAAVVLSDAFMGILDPHVWARVFSAILTGDIRVRGHLDDCVVTKALVIDQDDFKRTVDIDNGRVLPDMEVPCSQVGFALGMSEIRICGAVHLGLLKGRTKGKSILVKLPEVAAFNRKYVLLTEIRRRYNISERVFSDQVKALGAVSAGKIFTTNYWLRSEVEKLFLTAEAGLFSDVTSSSHPSLSSPR